MKQKILLFLSTTLPLSLALFLAQIYAPSHLKPLTNHVLDYPNKTIPTIIQISNNIPRITLSSAPSKLLWQPLAPLQIAMIREDGRAEGGKRPATVKDEPIKTQVYQEINKDEKFRYGYKVKDEETYVDKANGDTCTDGQGTISGTYCAPSGGRYNVAIESTQVAANEFTQKVAEKIVTLSETEIAKLSGTTLETACPEGDSACQVKVGNQIVYTLASDALIVKSDKIALSIATNWRENIKQNDFVNLSADNLKTKYQIDDVSQLIANLDPQDQTKLNSARRAQTIINDPSVSLASLTQNLQVLVELGYYQAEEIPQVTAAIQANQIKAFTDPSAKLTSLAGCPANNPGECRNLTWEEFLRGLGYDKEKVHDILSDRQTNVKNQVKLDAFLDPTKPPLSHAAQEQGQTLESYLKTIGVDEGDIKEVIQARQDGIADLALINDFANPLKSTPDIALQICGGDTDCKKNFVREDYLAQLHNQDYATSAKSAYQLNLFNFSKLVGDDSFKDLPVTIQNTLLNTNQDVQQAFAAYSFEKNKTPGTIVTPESSNQLALDFAKAIQSNPNIVKEYTSKFAENKQLYQGLIDTTRLFALTEGEKSSVVKAQLKDIAIHATISGLSNNGQVVSWDQASPEYKDEVRKLACKQDSSLTGLCRVYAQQGGTSTTLLDEKIENNSTQYLQQIFNTKTGANIALSTSFSSVATLDNPLTPSELKADAINFALNPPTPNAGSRGRGPAPVTTSNKLSESQIANANEYLDRQLVTETYKIGGGAMAAIGTSIIGAGITSLACGPGAPLCFMAGMAITGLAGWGATQVPLYEMTATEYAAQRNSDTMAASIWQSMYSNQGAWGDEGAGRSITTRDNQFALYDAINTATDGQLISQIQANPMLQANLAIQGQALNQWETFQNRQEAWTYASAPIAMVTSALSAGAGASAANRILATGFKEYVGSRLAVDAIQFGAGSVLNLAQSAAQFNNTSGDLSLLSTQYQIDYQSCVISRGAESCIPQLDKVNAEISANRSQAMKQAFATDALLQVVQAGAGYLTVRSDFNTLTTKATQLGIDISTARTVGEINNAIQVKTKALIDANPGVHPTDLAHLNNTKLTAAIATDPITDVQLTKLQGVQSDPNTQLNTIPTTNLEGKPATRIDIDTINDPTIKSAATAFNKLIETFESAAGFALYPKQVVELLSPNQIIQLKTENGGSLAGKTDVIMRILSVSESRSLILAKGETEAVGYVNDQMLSDSGKKFYGSQNTKGIYLDSQRGYLEIDFTRNSFDPKTASPMNTDQVRSLLAQSKTDPSLHLTLVGDRPNTVWTRLFGNTIDQGAFSNLLGRNKPSAEGVLFKEITQSTQHGKFLIIADEISDDIRGNFAVSKKGMALKNVKDPSLLGGLKSGSEALSVYEDAISGSTHQILVKARIAELEVGQSKSALLRGASNGQSVPVDLDTHARALSEIIDQTLSTSKERNNPLRQQLADISTRLKDTSTADAAITQLDTILSNNNKGDLAFDLSFRKASLQEDWNQLARVPDTDFGVEGKDLVLRKKSATTGERLSTATQLLSFYKQGKAMIDAFNPHLINAADTSQIPSLDSINIAPKGSQMDVATFYGELQAAGHQIRGLDATPQEALNALAINDTIKTKPLVPKNFGYGKATSEVITQFIQNRLKLFSKKASAIVLAGTNVDMDSDIKGILSTAHQNNADFDTLIITQYKQSPDGKTTAEYLQYQVKDGVIDHTKTPTNLGDAKTWNDTIQTQLKGSNPEKTLIIYKGRERAADLKVVATTHDNIRWSHLVDATGDDLPTSVNIEQMWRRDRTFSEDFDLYLATPKKGLTADNVWNFFEDNLYTKMASDRFADTIKALGSAPSYAIDNLNNIGDTLNLGFFAKRKLTNLQTTLKQQASSFESMLATATSRQPLPQDQLVLELYARGKATNDQLLDMANNIGKTLGLDDTQLARVKTQLGAEDNFVELTPFLTELNTVTKSLETPKSQSPQDLLLAYAHNNSFDPSSSPQYRVVTESHLASSLTPANTATKPTTESPITLNRPTNPILDSIASLIQTPQNLLAAALRTASIIINPTIPVLDNQPITNILNQPDVTLSFLTSDDRTIALFRVNNTLYYQTDDSEPISLTTAADALSRLPSPDAITRIVLNDNDLDLSTYRAPSEGTLSETIIESTKIVVEDLLATLTPSDKSLTTPSKSTLDVTQDTFADYFSTPPDVQAKYEQERARLTALYAPYQAVLSDYGHKASTEKWQFANNNPDEGYKIHLNVKPENVITISEFLKSNDYTHKYLSGGEVEDGKIFTIYTGSKTQTERIVHEISDGIGYLLDAPLAFGELLFAPNIVGRFVGTRQYFHQYGYEGVTLLDFDSGQVKYKTTDKDEFIQQAVARAKNRLTELYGDYYGGGITFYQSSPPIGRTIINFGQQLAKQGIKALLPAPADNVQTTDAINVARQSQVITQPDLFLDDTVIPVTSQDLVAATQKNLVFNEKFVADFFDTLTKARIATKNTDNTYTINPSKLRLNEVEIDRLFLTWAENVNPDLAPLINNYRSSILDALESHTNIDPEQQQIFINQLLASRVFFSADGNLANFEQYLQSVYGKTVKIIRVEQSLITEAEKEILTKAKSELPAESYTKLTSWVDRTPITKIIIESEGRQVTLPLIVATLPDTNINASTISLPGSNIHPIFINTTLRSRSLFNVIRTLAHETDHGVRSLKNPFSLTAEDNAEDKAFKNYFFPDNKQYPYGTKDFESLISTYGQQIQLANSTSNETLIAEMGGETASWRFLDTMIRGYAQLKDAGEYSAALLTTMRYDALFSRARAINSLTMRPYSVGSSLGDAITNDFGTDFLLNLIHSHTTDEVSPLLKPAIDETTKILTNNLDLTNTLYLLWGADTPITISPTKVMEDAVAKQIALEKIQPLNTPEAILEQLKEYTQKFIIATGILERIPGEIPDLLKLTNSADQMVTYLSTKNVLFNKYLISHPDEIIALTAQGKTDLMPHVEMLYGIFGKNLQLSNTQKTAYEELILAAAVSQGGQQIKPAIREAGKQLSDLLTSYGYESDARFSIVSGQTLDLPIVIDAKGDQYLDSNLFNHLLDRISLEGNIINNLNGKTIQINLTDNPIPAVAFIRFKEAYATAKLPFPFVSLEDALKKPAPPQPTDNSNAPSNQSIYAFDQSFVWFMELADKAVQQIQNMFDNLRGNKNVFSDPKYIAVETNKYEIIEKINSWITQISQPIHVLYDPIIGKDQVETALNSVFLSVRAERNMIFDEKVWNAMKKQTLQSIDKRKVYRLYKDSLKKLDYISFLQLINKKLDQSELSIQEKVLLELFTLSSPTGSRLGSYDRFSEEMKLKVLLTPYTLETQSPNAFHEMTHLMLDLATKIAGPEIDKIYAALDTESEEHTARRRYQQWMLGAFNESAAHVAGRYRGDTQEPSYFGYEEKIPQAIFEPVYNDLVAASADMSEEDYLSFVKDLYIQLYESIQLVHTKSDVGTVFENILNPVIRQKTGGRRPSPQTEKASKTKALTATFARIGTIFDDTNISNTTHKPFLDAIGQMIKTIEQSSTPISVVGKPQLSDSNVLAKKVISSRNVSRINYQALDGTTETMEIPFVEITITTRNTTSEGYVADVDVRTIYPAHQKQVDDPRLFATNMTVAFRIPLNPTVIPTGKQVSYLATKSAIDGTVLGRFTGDVSLDDNYSTQDIVILQQFIQNTLNYLTDENQPIPDILQDSMSSLPPSSPKSAQQAALDSLLGHTMGISAIPDFTEVGQSIATWLTNLLPPNPSKLPIGVQKYADSIDVPYSQIELINTTTGADGNQFYQIRVNNAYDIGIDENGVAWGGGVQISDVDYLKRKEATVQAEKRILGAGVISSFNYNRYEYYQFNQVKTLARKIFDVEQNATQDEIKQAYRDTIRLFSPDINKSPNAEIIFKTINDAYTILRTDKILYDTKTIDGKLAIETAEISAMRELFDPDYQVSPQSPPDTAKNLSNIWPKEIVLGRNGRADIPVNYANSKMSARHFSLGRDQDGYYIKDLGSTNGTFVNGQRISSKRYLKKGDVITAEETFTVNNVVDGLELIHKRAQDILYFDANTGAFTLNKNVAISQVWPKEIIFGRSSTTADIIIADELISRNHFSLGRDGKGYYVKDLDSTNGTFVNGKEITPQTKQYLKTGDAISSDKYDLFDFSVKITSSGLELYDNIFNKYLNFNQTTGKVKTTTPASDCSICSVELAKVAKIASSKAPFAHLRAALALNSHTYQRKHIQSTWNAVLSYLMNDYQTSLSHLNNIQSQLNDDKDKLIAGTEVIEAEIPNLDPTMQGLADAVPISGTVTADQLDTFNEKVETAITHVESKLKTAPVIPSILGRLLSPFLSLNQSYGNLTGKEWITSLLPSRQNQPSSSITPPKYIEQLPPPSDVIDLTGELDFSSELQYATEHFQNYRFDENTNPEIKEVVAQIVKDSKEITYLDNLSSIVAKYGIPGNELDRILKMADGVETYPDLEKQLMRFNMDYKLVLESKKTTVERAQMLLWMLYHTPNDYARAVSEHQGENIQYSGFADDPELADISTFISQTFGDSLLDQALISTIYYKPNSAYIAMGNGYELPMDVYNQAIAEVPEIDKSRFRAISFPSHNLRPYFSRKFRPLPIYIFNASMENLDDKAYLSSIPTGEQFKRYLFGSVAHEIGHYLHDYVLDGDQREVWNTIVDAHLEPITAYAGKYKDSALWYDEWFCEALRLKATAPEYLTANYPDVDQFLTQSLPSAPWEYWTKQLSTANNKLQPAPDALLPTLPAVVPSEPNLIARAREWVNNRYQNYKLNQWKNRAGEALTEDQKTEVINTLKNEPNGDQLITILVSHRTPNLYDKTRIYDNQEVQAVIQIINLTNSIKLAQPSTSTHDVINNLIGQYTNINWDKIKPYYAELSTILISKNQYTSVELFKNLSNSDIDLENSISQLVSLNQLFAETSRKDDWNLLYLLGDQPSQSALNTLTSNINFVGHILRSLPPQNSRSNVIRDYTLSTIIHDIAASSNPDTLFSQDSNKIEELLTLSRSFNRRSQYYYSGEIMAAGLKSPDLTEYLNQLNNLSDQELIRLISTFDKAHNLGESVITKKTKTYFDDNIVEIIRTITLNNDFDISVNFINNLLIQLNSFQKENGSYDKKSILFETLKAITVDNFEPDRILIVVDQLIVEPRVSEYKKYPKILKIWVSMNNDEKFIQWFNTVKNSNKFPFILDLAALQPSLTIEITNSINNLSINPTAKIADLLKYNWSLIAKDHLPTSTPQEIIELGNNIPILQQVVADYPGDTGKYIIESILTIDNPNELVSEMTKRPDVFRPLFLASDQIGDVTYKLKTIQANDNISKGIQQVRQENLHQKLTQIGISDKIIAKSPTLPGSLTYKLIQILNLYKSKEVSYENKSQLADFISLLLPGIPPEQLLYLTTYSEKNPTFLLYLASFRNNVLPYLSRVYPTYYEYNVAGAMMIDLFFIPALSFPELWNTNYLSYLSNNPGASKTKLVSDIISDLTTNKQIKSAWGILQKQSVDIDILIDSLPGEQQRFWQTFRDYPLIRNRWLELDGIDFFYSLSADQINIYTTLATKIDESSVSFIQKIKESLISQLLQVKDPVGTYENIDRTLTYNNLPEFIKLIKVFNYLYPKTILNSKISFRTSPVIQAQKSDGMRRLMLQLDLFHAAVESGNRNLEDYLTLFNEYGNLVDQFMGGKELNPQEVKQVVSFITKMDALYRSSNLTRIRSSLNSDLQQASNQTYLRAFIHNTLYTDLSITPETSLIGRIEELFLHNTGYTNLKDILAHMQSLRTQTTSRNLVYASTHPQLTLDTGDLMKAMVKTPKTGVILSILENGPRTTELMGDLAGNDSTALDTDLSMVTTADAQSGYKTIMEQSKADTTYGSLIFVTKNIPGRFYRSDLGETSSKGQFELFVTGVADAERHVGIRGAYPSSYFDAIINNGFTEPELDTLYQSITLNGFYIPVYSKDGNLIFTPQMYADRLKFFAGVHEEGLQINALSPQDPFSKIIQQNQLSPDLAANTKDIERVETPVRLRIKEVLSSLGISLADDPSSANLTDALLINIGSSGRGTNLPKDYDFDYTLVLNRQDYKKAATITPALRNVFPHGSETGSSANQVRLSQVNMVETTETIDLDIGIVTREDSMLYSSNQAVKDRLNSLSDNAKRQAIANILLTKKLLKDGHAYKAYEDGGFGGIGVENWILSNNGNIRQAFETFWNASHDKQGNLLTFQEFQRNYPIYDPGTNLRDQKFDNYVYKLQENGYQNMLEVINQHLRLPQKLVEKATNLGQQIGQTIIDLTAINPDTPTLVKWNLIDYQKTGGNQGGGNEGMLVKKSDTGETWYIKFHEDSEFLANEVLMDKIYEKAGIPVVESVLINIETENGVHIGRASKWVDSGDSRISLDYRDGFVIDAWLANFDGQYEKNRLGAIRVDNGSSLLFKSLGVRKNARYLTSEVSELKSMRSGYPGINDEMIITQINQLTSTMTDEVIKSLVEQSTLSYKDKQTLSRILIQRRNYFQQYIKTSQKSSLLPLPALTSLGARVGGSVLSSVSSSPLVSLLPNLPLLTYNTKTWIDNLGLVPTWLRERVQTSKQVWTNRHLTRVSLFPSNIIKMLNNPSLTKTKDIFGFEYSVRGKDGAIIKSGKLTEYTDIYLPATDDYNLTISGLTLSGADILAQYPDYQTYSWIDNAAINSVLILSVLGFGLGMITMLWTLADTVFKTQAGIYYFFVNTFGTNFANVVLGQFRDIFTLTGIFGMTFSMNRDLVYKFGKWFALFLINMFAVGWMGGEFWQANLRGDMVDIADLIAFSVVPISTIIYGAYSYRTQIINWLRRLVTK